MTTVEKQNLLKSALFRTEKNSSIKNWGLETWYLYSSFEEPTTREELFDVHNKTFRKTLNMIESHRNTSF